MVWDIVYANLISTKQPRFVGVIFPLFSGQPYGNGILWTSGHQSNFVNYILRLRIFLPSQKRTGEFEGKKKQSLLIAKIIER